MRSVIIILTVASVSLGACKSKKAQNATASAEAPKTTEVVNLAEKTKEVFPLVVSFYSPGDGINGEAHQQFLQLLSAQEIEVEPGMTPWGREGERDYCMTLEEMGPRSRITFINEVKQLLGDADKVRLMFDSPCVNKMKGE